MLKDVMNLLGSLAGVLNIGDRYILCSEGKPQKCYDHSAWSAIYYNSNNRIGHEVVGDTEIITTFLGIDHNYSGSGDPILFETCIFKEDDTSEVQARYTSIEEARIGHDCVVKAVKAGKGIKF